jgi:Protein of unknown function (DUF1554)
MFLIGQEGWLTPQECVDIDGDGCGNPTSDACTYPYLDCDDSDPHISPAEEETCDNWVDDDCDAAVDADDPDCQPPVPPTPKIVFVTSGVYDGGLGGVSGADTICQAEAQAAGLSGTFKAWVSDDHESPGTRFTKNGSPYQLADGTVIAADWNDLTDGILSNPIHLDADGIAFPGVQYPWTNTLPHGTPDNSFGAPFLDSCFEWRRVDGEFTGSVGSTNSTNSNWTDFSHHNCFFRNPLYCFEQ